MRKEKKLTIWGDINVDWDDWMDDIREYYPDATDDELFQYAVQSNADYLDDERMNLDIKLSQPILIIADLGLWNGRVQGYKEIDSCNIKDCLYDSDAEYAEWYVDELGDFRGTIVHHDGRNHYLYRTYKDNVSEQQIENFKDKLYHGKATRRDITRITRRLGDDIAEIYGWEI